MKTDLRGLETEESAPHDTMASWTKTEEETLLTEIKSIKSIYEIAKKHNRTPNAIHSRLHRIISKSVLAGTACPVEDIRAFLNQKPHREGHQLTIPMMFQQTFNRAKLQGLAEERRIQRLTHFVDSNVANGVLGAASQGKTSFLYERPGVPNPIHMARDEPTDKEIMDALRAKFPGSTVSWVEEWVDEPHWKRPHMPPTRVLKKGIKIDWS